jgi:hypothetical protein
MPSSTSSSEPAAGPGRAAWRRFFLLAAGTTGAIVLALFGFVALVDPFEDLPLAPPAHRVPVATNARYAFPALARDTRFDSAIMGTSTSRLLRPDVLNAELGGRFVNLAMNAATAWEQARMLDLFARAHAAPRTVIVGLDVAWCVTGDTLQRTTPRPFPEWMYDDDPWDEYAHLLNLDALEQAGRQFGIILGVKRPVYGSDGYTSFVPDDRLYDAARVAAHLAVGAAFVPDGARDGPPGTWRFPALDLLRARLAALPASTRKLLFFAPYHVIAQPHGDRDGRDRPGDDAARRLWATCKARVAAIGRETPNTTVADFMIPSPMTTADSNYWDPLHTRIAVADRLARDIAAAARGQASENDRLLVTPAPPAAPE